MPNKNVVDLSPKIFRIVSIMSMISIIIHVIVDIAYVGRIDSKAIVPSIILLVLSEHYRAKSIEQEQC